jgi:hypothetical protein
VVDVGVLGLPECGELDMVMVSMVLFGLVRYSVVNSYSII